MALHAICLTSIIDPPSLPSFTPAAAAAAAAGSGVLA
jgi:hypothetical protein